ncbi:sodium-dependent glucose transporter 1-like [Haliotis rubra]|uniref:sodium-dependent glucose transporter 1-like n=1 Tax=Haliotis rubra TaxID=36100 RepID=UPI001EE513E7|nr:sodium-dependent glucose transporter 1-like [Haliotis rubra]
MPSRTITQGIIFSLQAASVGFVFSVFGPSLPDLQCLFNTSLKALSLLFVLLSLGLVFGQSISGCLIKRFSPYLLMFIAVILQSGSYILLPLPKEVYAATVVITLIGISSGLGICVILHMTNVVWPGNVRITHLLFSVASAGCVLGPLLLTPFLSDGTVTWKNQTNFVHSLPHLNSYCLDMDNETHVDGSIHACLNCQNVFTMIQFAFLLLGLFGVPSIVGQLTFFIKLKLEEVTGEYSTINNETTKLNKPKAPYLVLMFLFLLQSQGFPSGFSALLSTFGVQSSHLSLSEMSLMTSFFWLVFTAGRLLSAFLSGRITQTNILNVCMVGNVIGTVVLCGSFYWGRISLWSTCVFYGLCSAPILPAGIGWSRHVIQVTPNIEASYMVSMSSGLVMPYICGFLMDTFGPYSFIYFFIAFCVYNCFIYISVHLYIKM